MKTMKCGLAALLVAAGGLGLTGCGGSNPNEREYLQSAPPGKPPDDPDDQKVAHRRERTRNVSKQVQKIEERNQGGSKKAQSP
jgi:hypothetical protein